MSNEDDGATVPASATRGHGQRTGAGLGNETGAANRRDEAAPSSAVVSVDAPAARADAERRTPDRTDGEAAPRRKRRRRRRRRGGAAGSRAQAEAAGVAVQTAATVELVPVPEGAGTEPAQKKRRRSRRPGRRNVEREPAVPQGAVGPAVRPTSKPSGRSERTSPRHRSNLYAALDLGTNNCRLLVATPRPRGDFRVVDAFSRIVRLGEGLAASGHLSDAAMDRAVDALKVCAGKLGSRPVRRLRLIATEACRRATNGEAFIERVERETGLELEIVDRKTEARLAVSGCGVLVDRQAKGAVLFDIGGGSSELSLLDMRRVSKRNGRGRKRGKRPSDAIAAWTSLPLGVVTLSEKHGGGRAVTRHVFESMVEEVMDLLQRFEGREALRELTGDGDFHLLGTSGTVTTLAGVHLQLPRYDRRYVDGVWMRSADVDRTIDDLIDMGFDRRVANPCIGRDRADLVLAGCAILVAIQRMWPCERLRVADRGLREGILSELMHEDGAWRQPKRNAS